MENRVDSQSRPAPAGEYSQGFINREMNDEEPEGGFLIFEKNGKPKTPKKPKQPKIGGE